MSGKSNLIQVRSMKRRLKTTYIDDPNLSWKAKGILHYLITKPLGQPFRIEDLFYISSNGTDSIRAGIEELLRADYLYRNTKRTNKEKNITGWFYIVFDRPFTFSQITQVLSDTKLSGPGWVYFLTLNGQVKIGSTSRHPIIRQLAFPKSKPLNSIYTSDALLVEYLFHTLFRKQRLKQEWFQLSYTDIEKIKKNQFPSEINKLIIKEEGDMGQGERKND